MENKQEKIIKMFNNIAPTYDKANRILSMGIDINWRKEACKESFKAINKDGLDIADIACGTGDMILAWQNCAKQNNVKIKSITGIDPSSGMIDIAKKKLPDTTLKLGQGDKIPLLDSSVDIISIAYGLRNIIDREKALEEFYRVTRAGGLLMILEFMKNEKRSIFSSLMNFYTTKILPFVGGVISKNKEAYEYLPKSIGSFISNEDLNKELKEIGFKNIFSKGYSAGVSSLLIYQKNY